MSTSVPATAHGIRAIGLPVWILIGAVAGILTGVVFGERAAIFQPIGSAYTMMLQVAVYPYLLCSLLSGLGRLAPGMAQRLLAASWGIYLFIWAMTLGSIWLLAHAIPPTPLPSVLVPSTAHPPIDILDLLIPANLFTAIGQNYVPAVVVFAIVYGIAIQRIQRKSALFEMLEAIQAASVTFWGWVVRVAPLGVFGLFAHAAGTIQPDKLGGLLLYLALFILGTILLAFVVLPAVLVALAPISYRELLRELRPALVLALVTTLSVVALPFVQKAAEGVAARAGCPEGEERTDVIKASVSISYVLAQLGNYFIYLLILYASYLYQVSLTFAQQLLLPFWTVLAGFGSPTATVDGVVFLGNWLRLPSDVLQLYIETWTVTRYGQVALSVMGFSFVCILVPLVYFRKVRLASGKLLWAIMPGVALVALVTAGGLALRPLLLPLPDNPLLSLTLDPQLTQSVEAKVDRPPTNARDTMHTGPDEPIARIISSGVLHVGYNPNVIPFSYWNDRGDLVGYDISFAYQLARDLQVRLELIPFEWTRLSQDLIDRRFDLAMAGIYVTSQRLATLTMSHSYYQTPVALIVPSARASQFLSRNAILAMPNLRIALFNDPAVAPLLRHLLPGVTTQVMETYEDLPAVADQVDGAFWTLQQAGAWAAAHPGFTAVAPDDMGNPIMLAYLMPPGHDSLRHYLDQWLELKANDGFTKAQTDYWLKGLSRDSRSPRWNLVDTLMRAWK